MKRKTFLLPILLPILLYFGCEELTNALSDSLTGKWYFIEGTSTTKITSDIDQNIIDSSVPGTGEITVTGHISSTLSYISYINIDSISYPVMTTQAIYDSSYPYGMLMVDYSSYFNAYSYIYYHKMDEDSEIMFLGQSDSSSVELGGFGDPITINAVTLYALDGWFIDTTIAITVDGSIAPVMLNVTADSPIEFNYTNNLYQYITYFSLEMNEDGTLEGLLELNIDGVVITDTIEVTYNLDNDLLTVYDEWFLGEEVFSKIDSIEILFSQDGDRLTLEFQYDPCQIIEDTLCYGVYESLVGLAENSLVGVQVTDNLVFSQIQPLYKKAFPIDRILNDVRFSKIRQNFLKYGYPSGNN